jgi:phosphate uptake regulator
MDIRKVQKTGDMHYIYLPTSWCKKHNITSNSRVGLEQNSEGILSINPQMTEKKVKHLKLNTSESDQEVIQKLIVACYINPTASFEINLEKGMDFTKLLDQKRIISLESVELDKNNIKYHSAIEVSDPYSLLKTMLMKIKNMLSVMTQSYNRELISRWEEEIDKNKLLIDKSVIGVLTYNTPAKMKVIDLYYVSLISKDLERMVDHLIQLDKNESQILHQISDIIDYLKSLIENINNKKSPHYLNSKNAVQFVKKVHSIKAFEVKDVRTYDKRRVRRLLLNISETVIDWAITKELEDV